MTRDEIHAAIEQMGRQARAAAHQLAQLSAEQKTDILRKHGKGPNGRATPEITRFKGLGEMMPKVLWETTLNPKTRRLLRVDVVDQIVTDRVMNELMGKDASARFRFIMERAEEAEELDL